MSTGGARQDVNAETENKVASDLRDNYRRNAALLLSSKPHLSRYFSLNALDNSKFPKAEIIEGPINTPTPLFSSKCNPTKPTSNVSTETSNDTKISATTTTIVGNDFICPCCGLILSPAYCSTTARLRQLKRGKTRRRRASRYKAASIAYQAKRTKTINGEWADHVDAERKLNYETRRVGDGEAKNCLVYTCGMCCTKVRYKGLPASRKRGLDDQKKELITPKNKSRRDDSKKTITPKNEARRDDKKIDKNIKTPVVSNKATLGEGLVTGSADFVPLGGAGMKSFASPLMSPLSAKQKKKRKRKSGGKKAGLTGFLNSLND